MADIVYYPGKTHAPRYDLSPAHRKDPPGENHRGPAARRHV